MTTQAKLTDTQTAILRCYPGSCTQAAFYPVRLKAQIKEKAMPSDWSPTKRRQKDLEAT